MRTITFFGLAVIAKAIDPVMMSDSAVMMTIGLGVAFICDMYVEFVRERKKIK